MSKLMPYLNVVLKPETPSGPIPQDPYTALSLRIAEVVRDQLRRKPNSCLGLPTGRTPTGCYKILSDWTREGSIDWSQARAFGLDEYYDVDESVSFRGYLEANLYRNINLPAEARHNPLFADNYDGLISQSGGLDLTILGIGTNGHIAFNEPGTPLSSWTHGVLLTESTRTANAEFFKDQIPTKAVTMGISTILNSKQIILAVSGKQKKAIIEQALSGPVTAQVPASFLQLHNNVVVISDF